MYRYIDESENLEGSSDRAWYGSVLSLNILKTFPGMAVFGALTVPQKGFAHREYFDGFPFRDWSNKE